MFLRDSTAYFSATDITNAVKCEWALMRKLDAKLGRIDPVEEEENSMLARAGALGNEHEERVLAAYRARFGDHRPGYPGGVAVIDKPATEINALEGARDATLTALRSGADVVFQGTFFADGFVGFADFLVREGENYEVYDTKLARQARMTALLQVAAYAEELQRSGIPTGPTVHLLLGDGSRSSHRRADIAPVLQDRVSRLKWMFAERLAAGTPIAWGADGYSACGRCAECSAQMEATRDVLLTAGLRGTQRARLLAAGIRTMDDLAASVDDVEGISLGTLARLRDQAAMQLAAPPPHPDGRPRVDYRVHDAAGLAALPHPDAGDIFFDFEGDPLYTEPPLSSGPVGTVMSDERRAWGLEYLFGVIEHEVGDLDRPGGLRFRPFWAHDRAQEGRALRDFLEYVRARRAEHPGMHIYHYADYERSHLQQLCARHGLGETILDDLLRENVLVDLYPVVKRSIRVSERSYGLKKLEPLYMGEEIRHSSVTDGAASVDAYVAYTLLVAAGDTQAATAALAEIADYNRYDCVSTLRLRDWLLARADEHGIARRQDPPSDSVVEGRLSRHEDTVRDLLFAAIDGVPATDRDAGQRAIALAAAAIEYHRREENSYWWEHFNRQVSPIEDWADQRDVLVVEQAEVVSPWQIAPGKQTLSRGLLINGRPAPGSRFEKGAQLSVMYADPAPTCCMPVPSGQRGEHYGGLVLECSMEGDAAIIHLEERAAKGGAEWHELPVALTPGRPIPTAAQRNAILEWGRQVASALPQWMPDATLDLMRREPPRLTSGSLSRDDTNVPAAIIDSILRLNDSYIAVQGPPGSGKTHVGARVIAALVKDHGWKIGVVAQSHSVVENLMKRVIDRGVDASLVAKRPPAAGYPSPPPWTALDNLTMPGWLDSHSNTGYVLGGTSWDFANPAKVGPRSLDLLVIDEAGQYSLANTIAVGVSAKNLLLLGDPQQLPQVSQGLHPEPVDRSALGWLSEGHDVLPDRLGYFLARSWRMHPALTAAVSQLAYEGRLSSQVPETTDRRLTGISPGLHPVPVEHRSRSIQSPEEVAEVVRLVGDLVGAPWTDPSLGRWDDPLRASDIIVVAAYNAQVELLRHALDDAGFAETPVGTVDKFQGQEAAVAIVSLAASSPDDVPRGLGFLLMRNRLNVAISRAKWCSYLVHSPALRDYLPHTPTAMAELSGFLRLVQGGLMRETMADTPKP